MEKLFLQGIDQFNKRFFFEAHDTWEELWRDTVGEQRLFFQGLIQAAVGFYHLENGNYKGACSQFGKSLAKLEEYQPGNLGIDTRQLAEGIRMCLHDAERLRGGEADRFDESRIPGIRFI